VQFALLRSRTTRSRGIARVLPKSVRRLPNKRLKRAGARRLWNESFFGAPQVPGS
jgi:hypothetical protein